MPSSPRTASDAAELERSRLQFEKMTQTPVPKLILGLAAPTILSMLITSIYTLANHLCKRQKINFPISNQTRCHQYHNFSHLKF